MRRRRDRSVAPFAAVLLCACTGGSGGNLEGFFVDVTDEVGLGYSQMPEDPWRLCALEPDLCSPLFYTGGAAVGDVDGDGLVDVVATRFGAHDLLFLNRGGRFEDASAAWGLDSVVAFSNGAALFDADLDGDLDLYVTTLGERGTRPPNDRYLFFDNEGGRFVEQGEARGLALADGAARSGTSIAVGDYDGDGYPDLYTGEWRYRDPDNLLGLPHERLLRNRGASAPGHFEDVTQASGTVLASQTCRDTEADCIAYSFAPAFADLDDDGASDLAVAADFGLGRLFWNGEDGTFEDGTAEARVATDENGMGSTLGDYDGDGDLDWFVTAIYDESRGCGSGGCGWGASGNRLYRNEGNRSFSDATDDAGVRDGGWGWGAAFFDFDHDGDLDLVMTNGTDLAPTPDDDHFRGVPMRLFVNQGDGSFEEAAELAGLADTSLGRGLCLLDLEGDGDLDIFVVRHVEGALVFRNERGSERPWLRVRALGPGGVGAAYGARVTVRVRAGGPEQVRQIGVGEHFLCAPEPVAHFGLGRGRGRAAEVRVRFPDGMIVTHSDVDANQTLDVVHP